MNLFSRAWRTIRHHRKSSILVFLYYFLSLSGLLLVSYFTFYLFLSRELIKNSIIAIKEYDNVFYAEPFEELRQTIQALMSKGQLYFTGFLLLIVLTTLLLQDSLFHLRKKEYRTYLLFNERKSTLSHQITVEQLILLNIAFVSSMILFFLAQSFITNFFSNLETSMIIQQEPGWQKMDIQTMSGVNSILDQTGFTRFHIKPFLIGNTKSELFQPLLWRATSLIFILINTCAYVLIFLTNYLLLRRHKPEQLS